MRLRRIEATGARRSFEAGCVLSTVVSDDFDDAGIAAHGEVTAAFAGSLDNLVELAAELGGRVGAGTDARGSRRRRFCRLGRSSPRRSYARYVRSGGHRWRAALLLSRPDGFGPLFYRHDKRGVFVATEPKQVVAGAELPRKPDLDVLEQSFFETYDEETPSALQGVLRVPKGTL